jgi:hypothetical protein
VRLGGASVSDITIYYNPYCVICRNALALIRHRAQHRRIPEAATIQNSVA